MKFVVVEHSVRNRDGLTYPYDTVVHGVFYTRAAAEAWVARRPTGSGWDSFTHQVLELRDLVRD